MIPIRQRLARILFLTVGTLAVLGAVGVFVAVRISVLARFDETLTAKARALITASEIDDGEFEIDLTVQDFAGFGTGGDDYFEIFRLGGESFLRSPSLRGMTGTLSEWRLSTPPPEGAPRLENGSLEPGVPVRVYLQRFQPKDDDLTEHADLFMVVASPIRSLNFQLAILGIVLTVAVVTGLVFMVPAIRFGLQRGLEPLETLSRRLGEMQPGRFEHRLDPETLPDELRPVAENLNLWLARLEESFERERLFSSNAAHELRTPLAELKSISQMGATWEDAATPERFREVSEVADEMRDILDKLALLARADAGQIPVNREPVRPADTVETLLERFASRIEEQKLEVKNRTGGGYLETDTVLFSAICRNLIDNAVTYAPGGTTVEIEVRGDRLAVTNEAPELANSDLDYLFDSFWRHDESRTGGGHSGLGLPIVRACADLLDARCRAELTDRGLLTIAVEGLEGNDSDDVHGTEEG